MKIRIELPAAVWPESREAAPVQAGLALPALAWLLGRASLTAATCQDKIARAPLLLADLASQSMAGYWLCADPVSLRLDNNSVTLLDAHHFAINQTESDALIAALNTQFASDGLRFVAASPTLWFVRLPVEPAAQFTPLAQVCGRNIAAHLPQGSEASRWHQILNEMQMLLYTHPVNDARAARSEALVNGVWLSEGGLFPPERRPIRDLPVFADDAVAQAQGRLAGVAVQALPASAALLENDAHLRLDTLVHYARMGDAYHWREGWLALEANWFAPLRQRYRAGEITMLEIAFPDLKLIATLPRGRAWQCWRRARQPWSLAR